MPTANDIPERAIRLRKSLLWTGCFSLAFFVVAGVGSVVSTLLSPPPNARVDPIWMAVFFGGFWGAFSCLAVWLLLAYRRERIVATGDRLIWHGVVRTRTIRFDDVVRVIWSPPPARRRVDLRTADSRLKIELTNFETADQLWLIQHLFRHLSERCDSERHDATHKGWEAFHATAVVPLQNRLTLQHRLHEGQPLPDDVAVLTRKRWSRLLLPTTILFAIVGTVLAVFLERPGMLAAPLFVIALWGVLHVSTPKEGEPATRLASDPLYVRFLTFHLMWSGLGLVAFFLIDSLKLPRPQQVACYVVGGVAWFAVLILNAVRLDRARRTVAANEAGPRVGSGET